MAWGRKGYCFVLIAAFAVPIPIQAEYYGLSKDQYDRLISQCPAIVARGEPRNEGEDFRNFAICRSKLDTDEYERTHQPTVADRKFMDRQDQILRRACALSNAGNDRGLARMVDAGLITRSEVGSLPAVCAATNN